MLSFSQKKMIFFRENDMSRRTLLASMLAAGLIGAAFPADAQQPDVYRIGAILSMSGSAPHYGTVMSRGALIAVAEIKDRKSVVSGKSVSVRVDLGGRRIITKKTVTRPKREKAK